LGHGVNYFKPFLYQEYYGCKRYNKIVLPCEKIISIALQYGWERKNIIQLGLPKWDLFYNYSLSMNNKLKEKCIFVMFTWRNLRSRKYISPYYFNNIFKLLKDDELRLLLNKNNITLYVSLHHNLLNNQNAFKRISNIKYINQDGIFNCLMKCSLVVSDFSSVIFDIIYRKMPFIIYVPDSEDVNIKQLYDDDYYNTINGLKNDSIYFENKFFRVDDTIKKIEFYINNNFELDPKLKTFYEQFNFNNNNNINSFINYLKSLK
jgi:CDP-glycerol glycerophosphotransferase (TagB/SpsB family)